MVSAMTAYLSDNQRKTLFGRARRHGTSLSQEVRRAIDLYLDLSLDFKCESPIPLTKAVNASMNRSIARQGDANASGHLPPSCGGREFTTLAIAIFVSSPPLQSNAWLFLTT